MKVERRGTLKRRADLLKRHEQLMNEYIKAGLSREKASKTAYEQVTRKACPLH